MKLKILFLVTVVIVLAGLVFLYLKIDGLEASLRGRMTFETEVTLNNQKMTIAQLIALMANTEIAICSNQPSLCTLPK